MGLWKSAQCEDGAVLVLVVAILAMLLGIGTLVIDVGHVFVRRTQLSNAVDAASLAGVIELPADPVSAWTSASDYLSANYASVDNASVVIGSDRMSVAVWASDRVMAFLGTVLGLESMSISARAKAEKGAAARVWGVQPFGVVQQGFVFGESYLLKMGPGKSYEGNAQLHGNFGCVALGGTGAVNYEDNIAQGYQGWIEVGQQIWTEPGNMSGPTRRGVEHLISQCRHSPPCTFSTVRSTCPRLVVTPVIDSLEVSGRALVTVVGFACFFVEDYVGNGNESYVVGRFLERQIDAQPGSAGYFGVSAVRLSE